MSLVGMLFVMIGLLLVLPEDVLSAKSRGACEVSQGSVHIVNEYCLGLLETDTFDSAEGWAQYCSDSGTLGFGSPLPEPKEYRGPLWFSYEEPEPLTHLLKVESSAFRRGVRLGMQCKLKHANSGWGFGTKKYDFTCFAMKTEKPFGMACSITRKGIGIRDYSYSYSCSLRDPDQPPWASESSFPMIPLGSSHRLVFAEIDFSSFKESCTWLQWQDEGAGIVRVGFDSCDTVASRNLSTVCIDTLPSCGGTNGSQVDQICSGHGKCKTHNGCVCDEYYKVVEKDDLGKSFCDVIKCDGIGANDLLVCNSHGKCVSDGICECNGDKYFGEFCSLFKCYGILSTDTSSVCSGLGHGKCVGPDHCECVEGKYQGPNCSIPIPTWKGDGVDVGSSEVVCFGKSEFDAEVCNGKGKCTDVDHCRCDGGVYGHDCGEEITTRVEVAWDVASEKTRELMFSIPYRHQNVDTDPPVPCFKNAEFRRAECLWVRSTSGIESLEVVVSAFADLLPVLEKTSNCSEVQFFLCIDLILPLLDRANSVVVQVLIANSTSAPPPASSTSMKKIACVTGLLIVWGTVYVLRIQLVQVVVWSLCLRAIAPPVIAAILMTSFPEKMPLFPSTLASLALMSILELAQFLFERICRIKLKGLLVVVPERTESCRTFRRFFPRIVPLSTFSRSTPLPGLFSVTMSWYDDLSGLKRNLSRFDISECVCLYVMDMPDFPQTRDEFFCDAACRKTLLLLRDTFDGRTNQVFVLGIHDSRVSLSEAEAATCNFVCPPRLREELKSLLLLHRNPFDWPHGEKFDHFWLANGIPTAEQLRWIREWSGE